MIQIQNEKESDTEETWVFWLTKRKFSRIFIEYKKVAIFIDSFMLLDSVFVNNITFSSLGVLNLGGNVRDGFIIHFSFKVHSSPQKISEH